MIYDESDRRSLLEKMQGMDSESDEIKFDDAQASMLVELVIPRMISQMPGMAAFGFTCDVERVDGGWTIQIRRPN